MKKSLKKVINQTVKNAFVDYVKYTGMVIIGFFLFLYLVLNIAAPQRFPKLYFQVVDEGQNAIVTFLQKMYKTPLFSQFFFLNQSANGRLMQQVRKDELTRQNKIVAYEQALLLNPQDRDILLALSRLYAQDGDTANANKYLLQAQAVDPVVK